MSYAWVSVNMVTGELIADLPGLECDTTSVELCQVTTTQATLPLTPESGCPVNWERAILEGGAFLVQLDTTGRTPVPVWGGVVTRAPRTEQDHINLSLASAEHYVGRRNVGDVRYTQVGQNAIIADLIARYVTSGSNGGIPMRVVLLDGPGQLRDREYAAADNKTVLSILQELSQVIGGPEWTIGWELSADQSTLTPVLIVGSRIGTAVPDGLAPAAVFSMPGAVQQFQQDRDFSTDKGANDLVAVSTAAGSDTIESPHIVTPDPNRPTYERRWSPSASITDVGTLTDHAKGQAPRMANGSRAVSFSADVASAPRLGRDWFIGDDVGFDITARSFPNGFAGTARTTGWQLDTPADGVDTITPVFADPGNDD
jgi:hypothetical protein